MAAALAVDQRGATALQAASGTSRRQASGQTVGEVEVHASTEIRGRTREAVQTEVEWVGCVTPATSVRTTGMGERGAAASRRAARHARRTNIS